MGRSFFALKFLVIISAIIFSACTMNATLESLDFPKDSAAISDNTQPKVDSKSHAQVTSSLVDINSVNVNNYLLSGSCGFTSSVDVKVNGVSVGTALCSSGVLADNGTWSVSVNLAAVADGNISISLNDVSSTKIFESKTVVKDVVPPSAALATPPAAINSLSSIASAIASTVLTSTVTKLVVLLQQIALALWDILLFKMFPYMSMKV